jgi:hypothetical protein
MASDGTIPTIEKLLPTIHDQRIDHLFQGESVLGRWQQMRAFLSARFSDGHAPPRQRALAVGPTPDEIHDLIPRIVRNPAPGQNSPMSSFSATCSAQFCNTSEFFPVRLGRLQLL